MVGLPTGPSFMVVDDGRNQDVDGARIEVSLFGLVGKICPR